MLNVGVLALQGAVEPHIDKLKGLGVAPVEVRTPRELSKVDGIILPGGESTAQLHQLKLNHLFEPLRAFLSEKPGWGVCAGCILMANKVYSPAQESLAVLDIQVERNAYGRQINSFVDQVDPVEGSFSQVEGVFIRAPKIVELGPSVKPLFKYHSEVVMVESGRLLASTFHPELTQFSLLHEYFIKKCMT